MRIPNFPARALSSVLTIVLALFVFSLGGVALAQEVSGTLKGTVVDQQGAVVPGATVTAVGAGTGLERTVTTDSEGGFSIAKLALGTYTLNIEKSGFKK